MVRWSTLRGAYLTGSLLLLYLGAELALVTPRTHLRAIAPGAHRSSVGLDCYPTNPRGYFDRTRRSPASRRPFGLRSIAFLPRQWEMFRVRWGMAEWYRDLYSQANRDGWQRTQASLQEMDHRSRSRGTHFLIAVWPVLVSLGGGYPLEQVHEAITAFCRGAGIACLDLLPALQGRSSVSLWVHPVDTHPNELAHRLVTANLAPAVRHLIEDGHR